MQWRAWVMGGVAGMFMAVPAAHAGVMLDGVRVCVLNESGAVASFLLHMTEGPHEYRVEFSERLSPGGQRCITGRDARAVEVRVRTGATVICEETWRPARSVNVMVMGDRVTQHCRVN